MSGDHGHGHGLTPDQAVSAGGRYLTRLWIAVGLGAVTFVLQVSVGLLTSSLALLADSAHVFTDVFGVALAAIAITVAQRTRRRAAHTYGLYRSEVLAALVNSVLLFAVAGWVLYEAIGALREPSEVPGLPVMVVAAVGLLMNLISFLLLRSGAKESLNIRGAYLEVMADMLGSFGVLASGAITLFTGWKYADPLIGAAIGLFVLPRAWRLGRNALRILFQHAPERMDLAEMKSALEALPNVSGVHDLHVWTLTSGMEVASAHLTTAHDADLAEVLGTAQRLFAENYHIEHATLQLEPAGGKRGCHQLNW
ncbi:cation diffusion facilitator family transporter [Saccharomonospora sp. NPDC046836]|uniref:cation diffusion facilitator family transporter n=1 Tax=Saccharomonospora sp. NPDC046836 TaxID=3156921 RepID=UPI0033E916DB